MKLYLSQSSMVVLIFLITVCLISCSESVETSDNFEVVEFPDGSVAYLNINSSIKYDKSFKNRNVDLSGEAFFIIEESNSPFSINTDLGEITVTGTELNIKVDDDLEELEVDVAKGEVEMKTKNEKKSVRQGEKAIFNKKKGSINKGKSNQQYKKWLKELNAEFAGIEKDIKKGTKAVEKEADNISKKLKKLIK